MKPHNFIPVCEPVITQEDIANVLSVLASGWVSGNGPEVEKLELNFAKYLGVEHAVAVNTGTAAVHLMIISCGLKPGDEIIVPTFTMAGSIFPIIYAGIIPIFVDADPETWCINAAEIENKITNRTRAIMAVHIYGYPCDMNLINELAIKYDLIVLEDAAEALGSQYMGEKCGSFGTASAFSLFANKVITSGEGGIVVTDNSQIAAYARKTRNLSFPEKGERDYIHDDLGFNYRLSNILAALGNSQLNRLDQLLGARISNDFRYRKIFENHKDKIKMQPINSKVVNSSWMVGITVEAEAKNIQDIRSGLKQQGIETRPFFKPMHSQKALTNLGFRESGVFPVAEKLARTGFYLPSSSNLSDETIEYVASTLLNLTEDLV